MLEALYMIQFIKTHKTFFLTLAVVLFGIMAWETVLLYQKNAGRSPQQPATTTTTQQLTSTSTWQTYRNEELGFEIQIPQRWVNEYKIEEGIGEGGYLGSVSFSRMYKEVVNPYTKETAIKYYTVLYIAVVTKEWWEDALTWPTDRPTLIFDMGNKKYIYGQHGDSGDREYDNKEYDEGQAMIKTFNIIK